MAEKSWFYAQNGERQGPVSEAEAQRLVQDGTIGPDADDFYNYMGQSEAERGVCGYDYQWINGYDTPAAAE